MRPESSEYRSEEHFFTGYRGAEGLDVQRKFAGGRTVDRCATSPSPRPPHFHGAVFFCGKVGTCHPLAAPLEQGLFSRNHAGHHAPCLPGAASSPPRTRSGRSWTKPSHSRSLHGTAFTPACIHANQSPRPRPRNGKSQLGAADAPTRTSSRKRSRCSINRLRAPPPDTALLVQQRYKAPPTQTAPISPPRPRELHVLLPHLAHKSHWVPHPHAHRCAALPGPSSSPPCHKLFDQWGQHFP